MFTNRWSFIGLVAALVLSAPAAARASKAEQKQKSLDEWRALTATNAPPPRVFVKGDQIRFYFSTKDGVEAFKANWSHVRVPTKGYRVNSAILRWNEKLQKMPEGERGWREATVIAGREWRHLATNLIARLAPPTPLHGAYYQTFLADGLVYRDAQGRPRFVALSQRPQKIVIDHRYSVEETLDELSKQVSSRLTNYQDGKSLFLLMAPDAERFTQPLLLDRERRQCVYLAPAALFDFTERGLTVQGTAQSVGSLLFESHGIALLKNPVSSAARLLDLGVETVSRFLRAPLPRTQKPLPALNHGPGMDLAAWEKWLDTYTGTRREQGSLRLRIDGDQFFDQLKHSFQAATNYIHVNVYIFDRDDVAVGIADQLKERAREIEVKVIMDRLGSIAGGQSPPATPLPPDFTEPGSIAGYLARDSKVHVRLFLNPWFSADHSKVIVVDGNRAWLGGMNFGREYRYEWHDMMVELEGPVVVSLENEFRHNWAHTSPLGDLAYTATMLSGGPQPEPQPVPGDWMDVRRLPTKTGWKPFNAAIQGSLRRARNYVYVENPYLFDKRVIASLVRARLRGVDVRVIFPRINDFKPGARSNLVMANYLLQHGVRVFFYPAMSHVKAVLVDDWACVGSGNLNHLSLRLNQEQNVATSDPAFAARLRQDLFEEDFKRSYELTTPIAVDWMDFLSDLVLENF